MSLLKSIVFFDVMQVVSSQNYGSVHLIGKYDTLEDSTSDGYIGSEWALLVNINTSFGIEWGLETYIK